MPGNSMDIREIMASRDQKAAIVSRQFDEWIMARREAEKLWAEVYAFLYATDTRKTSNAQNPWDNTTNIPKLAQIRDNLEANYVPALFPNEEWMRFLGDSPESVSYDLRQKLEAYFKIKHDLSDFEDKVKACLRDWIETGNCFGREEWVVETAVDPITGDEVVSYVGPKLFRISPYDIVFNALATSFEESPKIIRSLYSRGELARMAEEQPEQWPQEVLDKIDTIRYTASSAPARDTNKYLNLRIDGFGTASQYFSSGYVEVLEFFGDIYSEDENKFYKNRQIKVVDRMWVVVDEEIKTWSGRPRIVHSSWRKRPDNLWGQGPLEPLVGMQYRINHLENAKADAYDQQLDPDLVIKGSMDIVQDGARKLYISEDTQGDVRRLAPETTILQANMEIGYLMNMMEEMAGAPRDAMGIRTPGEKTAFEVSELYERAGRVFQNKVKQFDSEFLRKILSYELELARINLAAVDTIPVTDEEGITEFLEITPADIRSKGRLIPVGAQHFSEQSRLIQTLTTLQQSWLQDPSVNVHISGQRLAQVLVDDILNYSKYQLYSPFVRITEQAEAQKYAAAAQDEIATQDQMAAEGLGDEVPI